MKEIRNSLLLAKQLLFSRYKFDVFDFSIKNSILITLQILKYYFEKPNFIKKGDFLLFNIDYPKEYMHQESIKYNITVGVSYCQKPLNCPSGRFNDKCNPKPLSVCKNCTVNQIREHAINNNLRFIIITTSFEFARLHLKMTKNSLRGHKTLYIVSVCPYILNISKLFSFILGVKLISIPLIKNGCNSSREFLSAEKGYKAQKTEYMRTAHNAFLKTISHFGKTNKYLK